MDLLEIATAVRQKAHCPYSKYQVGAAIRLTTGEVFGGCNVENASYGATICAERGAIMSAVAAVGKVEIAEIVVITSSSPPGSPCGMCRQVIAEFTKPDAMIWSVNDQGESVAQTFGELLPNAFGAAQLG
ncbi:cytidine deaminase [bacterium]|nr:MAG: cytidine deaminase [bacterium]